MTTWAYVLKVPDDVPESELAGYRELAIATWRTGAEAMGGFPGEATATLVAAGAPASTDSTTSPDSVLSSREWHIRGEVT